VTRERLTPAALVAYVREGLGAAALLGRGEAIPIDDVLPVLAAGIEPFATPDFVCVMVGAPGVSEEFPGIDGLYAGWRDWGATFAELDLVFEDLEEVRAGALVLARQLGVTRHDGMAVEQPSAMLLRLRDGHIAAVEFHLDRALAAAAGAEPG